MLIIDQDDYKKFRCIAGDCPKSCCEGWQIVVDEESLERFMNMPGAMGERLRGSLDLSEKAFLQKEGRCTMLTGEGLCSLQKEEGEESLCSTCRRYPRHMEEYEGVREFSLSLSCPEAARLLIGRKKPMTYEKREEAEISAEEDWEDFDEFLYSALWDARDCIREMAEDEELGIEGFMDSCLELGRGLQQCVDEGRVCDIEELLEEKAEGAVEKAEGAGEKAEGAGEEIAQDEEQGDWEDFERDRNYFSRLLELEQLEEDWEDILLGSYAAVFENEDSYREAMELIRRNSGAARRIIMFFIYTYFCGSVYNNCVYSKTALAVYSCRFIFFIACYFEKSVDKWRDPVYAGEKNALLIKAAYRYAREVEHSDENIRALEDFFMDEYDREMA